MPLTVIKAIKILQDVQKKTLSKEDAISTLSNLSNVSQLSINYLAFAAKVRRHMTKLKNKRKEEKISYEQQLFEIPQNIESNVTSTCKLSENETSELTENETSKLPVSENEKGVEVSQDPELLKGNCEKNFNKENKSNVHNKINNSFLEKRKMFISLRKLHKNGDK